MTDKKKRIVRAVVPPVPVSRVAEALRAVLGSERVHAGSDSDLGEPRLFIPSGVPDLDRVLDREGRGWPSGRIVEVYGGEATCKTGLLYALYAQAQKLGGTGVLYPTEGNFDEWLAEQYGVDLSNLAIGDDETVQGVFEATQKVLTVAKPEDPPVIVGIDSIAALVTREELEDESFDRDRAAQIRAMLISKALRKLGARVPRSNMILFCVNQVRDAVATGPKAAAGKPKPPGGRALRFYASIRLRIEMLKKFTQQRDGIKKVAGFLLRITAEKNRMARPYESCVVQLDFEHGLLPAKGPAPKDEDDDDEPNFDSE